MFYDKGRMILENDHVSIHKNGDFLHGNSNELASFTTVYLILYWKMGIEQYPETWDASAKLFHFTI